MRALARDALRRLTALDDAGLRRSTRVLPGPRGPVARIDGREVIVLCSNDYLGLASHPALAEAAAAALAHHGVGAGASRLISGTSDLHVEAERALADLLGAEAALLFSSGWAANVSALDALFGRADVVFSDELNHASLIDGCRLTRAAVHVYRHRDLDHLDALLRAERGRHRLAAVVTDAVFSMDGHRADLRGLRALCDRHDAALYVDEAHALGVIGPAGRGLCASEEVTPDLALGTLGKALGAAGAFLAGPRPTIDLLQGTARSFVYSTAPPPAVVAAATRAVALALGADDRRARLASHTERLRAGLRADGWRVPDGDAPIVPVLVGDPTRATALSAALLERGVLATAIRPPTVPDRTSRLRLVPTAAHEEHHIEHVIGAFADLGEPLR